MIKPEQVPRDAILAARDEIRKRLIEEPDVLRHMIAAAINAWPGGNEKHSLILLTLPQEKNDAFC